MNDTKFPSAAGIILAGGKSRRIGGNKAFLKLGGRTFIEIIVDKLRLLFKQVIIVANTPGDYRHLQVQIVKDLIPGKGSLGGIYSGLFHSESHHNFVTACDMPFLNVEVIKYMQNTIEGYDVIIPKRQKGLEPLHAFYSRNCLRPIKKYIDSGTNLKILDFFSAVKVSLIVDTVLRPMDQEGMSFFNINTPADLESARQYLPLSILEQENEQSSFR